MPCLSTEESAEKKAKEKNIKEEKNKEEKNKEIKKKENKEKKVKKEKKDKGKKEKMPKEKKEKKKEDKKDKDKKNKERKGKKKDSKSDHSSSSPHGVGSPSGAIGKVTSASSSLSSASTATAAEAAATSKVRVTFFESEKPHVVVGSPEPITNAFDANEDLIQLPLDAQGLASGSQQQQQLLLLATSTMTSPSPIAVPSYERQTSNDSGWDNPFQPDGDLSREADEIVELIKGGKPITPTPGSAAPPIPSTGDTTDGIPSTPPGVHNATTEKSSVSQVNSVKPADGLKPPSSPKEGTGANGNAAVTPNKGAPSSVEVQRGHVPPGDACQVEHVVLKKKPKCKCCVIQ